MTVKTSNITQDSQCSLSQEASTDRIQQNMSLNQKEEDTDVGNMAFNTKSQDKRSSIG